MPAAPENNSVRRFDIDRASHTIRFERLIDAAAQTVFEAWTQTEEISRWWDPAGEPLLRCEIDLRPGGSFTFVPKGHPEMPFSGVYLEIAPPGRLVFEAFGATGRVTLQETAGKTRMNVDITCRSAEHLDEYIRMGVDVGTAQTLDNLVAFAGRRAA